MKNFITLLVIGLQSTSYAQTGSSCADAIPLNISSACNYVSFSTTSNEFWFSFVPSSEFCSISLKTVKFGINAPHIHNISLFKGLCSNNKLLTEDELPFVYDADRLEVSLDASNLIVGNTYYIVAHRKPTSHECDKASCSAANYTYPTTFQICVQSLDIIIPPDFNSEPAAASHGYIQNKGQVTDANGFVAGNVRFSTFNVAPDLYILDSTLVMTYSDIDEDSLTIDTLQRVDWQFNNVNRTVKMVKTEQRRERTNYYLPQAPKGIANVGSFDRIICYNMYDNTDVHYYSSVEGLKMYFVVKPGGNPADIHFSVNGANNVVINSQGNLMVTGLFGDVVFGKPVVYQIAPGIALPPVVSSGYITSNGGYRISIGTYNPALPLVIMVRRKQEFNTRDTSVPFWGTYFGGTQEDKAHDLVANPSGNLYMVGETKSLNGGANPFPISSGLVYQDVNNGGSDGFIAAFDTDYALIWSTFLGGNNEDVLLGVSFTPYNGGKLFVGGYSNSSSLFSIPFLGAYNDNNIGGTGVIGRFDPISGTPDWLTAYGGIEGPVRKLKADSNGNLYVIGEAAFQFAPFNNSCAPVAGKLCICNGTVAAYQQFPQGGSIIFRYSDAYMAKFNNQLQLQWSTAFGGASGDETGTDLVIDEQNNKVYFVGYTTSVSVSPFSCTNNSTGSFPLCNNGTGFFDSKLNYANSGTESDGWVARFSTDGTLEHSTFFGGNNEDYLSSCAINSTGELWVMGASNTSFNGDLYCVPPSDGGFPVCNTLFGYFQSSNYGLYDYTVLKFNNNLQLEYSSFNGYTMNEGSRFILAPLAPQPAGVIELNFMDEVLIAGETSSGSDGSPPNPLWDGGMNVYSQAIHADALTGSAKSDGIIAKYAPPMGQQFSTYFGGKSTSSAPDGDIIEGLANVNYNIFVSGWTYSTTMFPYNCPSGGTITSPYCQSSTTVTSSNADAFLAQINEGIIAQGVEENSYGNLMLYPNPATSKVTVECTATAPSVGTVLLFDLSGRLVYATTVQAQAGVNRFTIPTGALGAGVYTVTVTLNDAVYTSRLIKN